MAPSARRRTESLVSSIARLTTCVKTERLWPWCGACLATVASCWIAGDGASPRCQASAIDCSMLSSRTPRACSRPGMQGVPRRSPSRSTRTMRWKRCRCHCGKSCGARAPPRQRRRAPCAPSRCLPSPWRCPSRKRTTRCSRPRRTRTRTGARRAHGRPCPRASTISSHLKWRRSSHCWSGSVHARASSATTIHASFAIIRRSANSYGSRPTRGRRFVTSGASVPSVSCSMAT